MVLFFLRRFLEVHIVNPLLLYRLKRQKKKEKAIMTIYVVLFCFIHWSSCSCSSFMGFTVLLPITTTLFICLAIGIIYIYIIDINFPSFSPFHVVFSIFFFASLYIFFIPQIRNCTQFNFNKSTKNFNIKIITHIVNIVIVTR